MVHFCIRFTPVYGPLLYRLHAIPVKASFQSALHSSFLQYTFHNRGPLQYMVPFMVYSSPLFIPVHSPFQLMVHFSIRPTTDDPLLLMVHSRSQFTPILGPHHSNSQRQPTFLCPWSTPVYSISIGILHCSFHGSLLSTAQSIFHSGPWSVLVHSGPLQSTVHYSLKSTPVHISFQSSSVHFHSCLLVHSSPLSMVHFSTRFSPLQSMGQFRP